MRVIRLSLPAAALILGGCYHATINTGKTPSPTVIEQAWASGWIFGLIPPKPVEAAAQCPSGVARVDTQLSFLNQVVSLLTIGIYTPMDIRVTCAAASGAMLEQDDAQLVRAQAVGGREEAFAEAVELSRRSGRPVTVDLRE